jgi:hypothetical protein
MPGEAVGDGARGQDAAHARLHVPAVSLDLREGGRVAQDAQRQSWQPQGQSAGASTATLNADPVLPVMTEGIDSAGRLDIRI